MSEKRRCITKECRCPRDIFFKGVSRGTYSRTELEVRDKAAIKQSSRYLSGLLPLVDFADHFENTATLSELSSLILRIESVCFHLGWEHSRFTFDAEGDYGCCTVDISLSLSRDETEDEMCLRKSTDRERNKQLRQQEIEAEKALLIKLKAKYEPEGNRN